MGPNIYEHIIHAKLITCNANLKLCKFKCYSQHTHTHARTRTRYLALTKQLLSSSMVLHNMGILFGYEGYVNLRAIYPTNKCYNYTKLRNDPSYVHEFIKYASVIPNQTMLRNDPSCVHVIEKDANVIPSHA